MTEYVYRPLRRGKRARLYYGRYALNRGDKPRTVALSTPDIKVARKRLRDHVVRLQREQEGLIAPKAQTDTAAMPLPVLLIEYIADMRARGCTEKHIRDSSTRITRCLAGTKWNRIGDITPDSFVKWRATLTCAPKTAKEYHAAVNAWLNWLADLERIERNRSRKSKKSRRADATCASRAPSRWKSFANSSPHPKRAAPHIKFSPTPDSGAAR